MAQAWGKTEGETVGKNDGGGTAAAAAAVVVVAVVVVKKVLRAWRDTNLRKTRIRRRN